MVYITAKRRKGLRLFFVSKGGNPPRKNGWAVDPHRDQKFSDSALSFLVSQTHTASCFSAQVNPDA